MSDACPGLQVHRLPFLALGGWLDADLEEQACCTVLDSCETYVLSRGCALTWSQLLQVSTDICRLGAHQVAFYCPQGLRLEHGQCLPRLFVGVEHELPYLDLELSAPLPPEITSY